MERGPWREVGYRVETPILHFCNGVLPGINVTCKDISSYKRMAVDYWMTLLILTDPDLPYEGSVE